MLVLIYLPRKDGKLSWLRRERKSHKSVQISEEPGSNWGPCGRKAEILPTAPTTPALCEETLEPINFMSCWRCNSRKKGFHINKRISSYWSCLPIEVLAFLIVVHWQWHRSPPSVTDVWINCSGTSELGQQFAYTAVSNTKLLADLTRSHPHLKQLKNLKANFSREWLSIHIYTTKLVDFCRS